MRTCCLIVVGESLNLDASLFFSFGSITSPMPRKYKHETL